MHDADEFLSWLQALRDFAAFRFRHDIGAKLFRDAKLDIRLEERGFNFGERLLDVRFRNRAAAGEVAEGR